MDALTPEAFDAIRVGISTGDWSAFPDDVAAALQQAVQGDYSAFEPGTAEVLAAAFEQERSDPWAGFDPEVAALLKGVFDHEIDRRFEPLRRFEEQQRIDAEDRAFARDEQRLRAIYGPAYDKNREDILRFAIENRLPNLELAFNAYRGQSPQNAAVEAQTEQAPEVDRVKEIETRLAELKHGDTLAQRNEAEVLRRELSELRDEQAQQLVRAANDPSAGRQEMLHDVNDASRRRNAIRSARVQFGKRDEKTVAMGKEEKRSRLDLEALDVVQGRSTPQKPKRVTRDQRDAELNRFDARDHEAVEVLRGRVDPSRTHTAPRQSADLGSDPRDNEAVAVLRGEFDPSSTTAEAVVSAVADQ